MITSLLLLLAIPAPPNCPWEGAARTPLNPQRTSQTYPINGSFWVVDYSFSPQPYELADASGSTVAVTNEPSAYQRGTLVRIRPDGPLDADTMFRVQTANPTPLISVKTGTAADTTPPSTPVIRSMGPNVDPYSICPTAGVVLQFEPVEDDVFYLAEADDGTILGIGAVELQPFNGLIIPTEANASVTFSVVAVDFAGNRSDATAMVTAMAKEVPFAVGRLGDDGSNGVGSDGGCTCVSSDQHDPVAPWLMGLLLVPLIQRSRRGVRPSV